MARLVYAGSLLRTHHAMANGDHNKKPAGAGLGIFYYTDVAYI